MLNFSKFQKIADDGKTVTMRHEKGHEMKILLRALRPIEREQIKRLKMAEGGKIQRLADGTDDKPLENQPTDSSTDQDNQQSQAPAGTHITINAGAQPTQPAQQTPLAQPVQVPQANVPNFAPVPGNVQTSNMANPTGAALTQQQAQTLAQKAGNTQQFIQGVQSQANVPLAQQQQNNAVASAARIDNTVKDFQTHTNDMAKYLSDPKNMDPMSFYEKMSTPGKIGTALGLILGGFKQGFSGGNNPAMDWLVDQQNKDIAAQKQKADNMRTVWGAYNSLYGNENVSTELAKKSWNDKLAAQANETAAKLGTPQAAVNNQLLQSKLLQDNYDHLQKAAFIADQPMGGGSGGPPAQVMPQEQSAPKEKTGPEHADVTGVYNIRGILAPDVDSKLKKLQAAAAAGSDPRAAADLPIVMAQLSDATQRDAMLSQAPELYHALTGNATTGGWVSRNISGGALGTAAAAIPGVGPLLGTAIGTAGSYLGEGINALNTLNNKIYAPEEGSELRKEENYNIAHKQLSDYLRKAYPAAGAGEIESKLQGIIPDKMSDKDNVTKHMKSFEDLVKTGGQYDALERWGMTNK